MVHCCFPSEYRENSCPTTFLHPSGIDTLYLPAFTPPRLPSHLYLEEHSSCPTNTTPSSLVPEPAAEPSPSTSRKQGSVSSSSSAAPSFPRKSLTGTPPPS